MDRVMLKEKFSVFLQKYKYVALVLLLGIGLMLIPSGQDADEIHQSAQQIASQAPMEQRLEQILGKVWGAGKVSVMLTQAEGEKTVYQTDMELSDDRQKQNTVIITQSDRAEAGLIQQTLPPVYLGAIIVCEGADDPKVKLAICEAVAKVTGLGMNQISVVKMK